LALDRLHSISFSDPVEHVWFWNYEGNKLYLDIDERIRFQVLSEIFTDTTPTPANIGPAGRRQSAADTTAVNDLAANSKKIPPYGLTVRALVNAKHQQSQ
jgi:DNA-directed RNA polymerase III subunit RPC8